MNFGEKQKFWGFIKLLVFAVVAVVVWRHYGDTVKQRVTEIPSPTDGFDKPKDWDGRVRKTIECQEKGKNNCKKKTQQ